MRTLFFLFLLLPFCVPAQTINTYVGTGTEGYTGDGGPAVSAEIGFPVGLNFDDSGNLVICTDGANGLVRKINVSTGIITTIAGSDTASSFGLGGDGGPATSALVNGPFSVCFDNADNFYIADNWYSEIRKVTVATGIIDTFAGDRTPGNLGDGGPAKSAELGDPVSVCFDTSQKYLYISTEFGREIRRVDMLTDTITTYAGTGVIGYSGDGGLATNANFSRILGICIDRSNNLYVGDWDNARIRKINAATSIITTICGNGTLGYSGDGGPAINAMISKPTSLCFDKCGDLYFSDEDSCRVRRIDGITGIITTIAGNGTAGFSGDGGLAVNAEFNHPTGIAIDTTGNIYIGDCYNFRIRKTTYPVPYIKIATTTGGDTICVGSTATITATVAGGGPAPTYQWVVNGVAMSGTTSSSYIYTPATGDSVSCILTSSSPCVGNTTAISNTIHFVAESTIVPTITLTGTTTATPGTTVTVTATVFGAGGSYIIKWYDNGVLFATTTSPTTTYTMTTGADTITATIIPSGSCYDSATSAAHVVTASNEGIAGIMSPSINIYPNPAHNEVVVTGDNISLITLSNTIGQVLISRENISGKTMIDIAALPPGIYQVTVTTAEGQRIIMRLVKE